MRKPKSPRSEGVFELNETPRRNDFTAVIEREGEGFIACCPEIPGANGQGKSKAEAIRSLSEAVDLILEDRREDALRGLPPNAERDVVTVG